ncbi:hypothetical protein Acr_15g0005230 [Actinidia rufa]|uniref:F-box associated beta-propeller type 3 domain-containing protein n=1 Tax=Actinidia rufa TaxID=165716 RepID=A0A7J0FTL8_9ERIC|nr:hypothetical protein Acr_15g0005230 [Actinidia rufa]
MKSGDPGMAVRKLRVEYGIKLDCTMMNAGPEEIVFFILVRLPADILYNSAQDRQNMDDLEFRDRRKRTIRVANPLIKKVATVPPLTVQGYHYYYFSLACTRSRREYKVVVFAYGSNLRFEDFDCMVVTLGKDHAWKLINNSTKFPSSCPKLFCYRPLSKGGFLYWAHFDLPFVVTLDVESEMFYEFPSTTAFCEGGYTAVNYLIRGKSLSCMVQLLGSPGIMFWDIWDLCDPMRGEWKKVYRIEWDFKKRRSRQVFKGLLYRPPRPAVKTAFVPIAWVNNGEVVLFCVSCSPGPYIAYNVKTRETFTFGGQVYDEGWCFGRDFAYSLVWLTPSSLITRGGGGGGS